MKLAILVVYMFDRELASLAQLHLQEIEKNTPVPFTVYGSVTRLNSAGRNLLARFPFVRQIEPALHEVAFDHRSDHATQLDAARKAATRDGATHFCTMHIDSFPVRRGWVDRLLFELDKGRAFACIAPYAFNAGLFWPEEWEKRRIGFLVPPEARADGSFEAFHAEHSDLDPHDGGIGFMFHAWKLGLSWHEMRETSPNIWGGLMLHIVGTTRLTSRDKAPVAIPQPIIRVKNWLRPLLRFLPRKVKAALYRHTRRQFVDWQRQTWRDGSPAAKKEQVLALTRNPSKFVSESIGETFQE